MSSDTASEPSPRASLSGPLWSAARDPDTHGSKPTRSWPSPSLPSEPGEAGTPGPGPPLQPDG
eukprot:6213771-Lingulodinium_polyedra.AAC.1